MCCWGPSAPAGHPGGGSGGPAWSPSTTLVRERRGKGCTSRTQGLTFMMTTAIMAADTENMMAASSMTTAAPMLVWKKLTAASQPLRGQGELQQAHARGPAALTREELSEKNGTRGRTGTRGPPGDQCHPQCSVTTWGTVTRGALCLPPRWPARVRERTEGVGAAGCSACSSPSPSSSPRDAEPPRSVNAQHPAAPPCGEASPCPGPGHSWERRAQLEEGGAAGPGATSGVKRWLGLRGPSQGP